MRVVVALVAVTGCGRVAFEPRTDAGGGDVVDAAIVCPPGYTRETPTSCYRAGVGSLSWLQAEAACEVDGAHLAVIGDSAEAVIASKYLPSPTDFAWIGAADVIAEGSYRDVTNRAVTYLAWAAFEPEGAAEDCITLVDNNNIADFDCANPDEYICEYDGISAVSVAWGACPAGYTFAGTGCYRFIDGGSNGVDWFAAEADCENDGAGSHLVVLDDSAEAGTVDSFVPPSILDHFIGVTDLVTEGVYLTVLNEPLAYTMFAAGEPNGGTVQNCMLLDDATTLNDKPCDEGEDYVCEYDGKTPVPASWGQ